VPSEAVTHIDWVAAYRFVDIDDPQPLRERLFNSGQAAGLKGTVLLAHEGINLMLAGEPQALQKWLDALMADARFAGLELKRHRAEALPFGHLRVKVKAEIIRMNQPHIRPAAVRAPAVAAATLVRWLAQGHCDAGRPLALLDTRNGFEVDAGAFEGAIDWRLERFSDFPAALAAHADVLKGKTVVSYCTGGIRCEKAALWMQQAGVEHVHQLDGGILKYFDEHSNAPGWAGRCVVFDERESVAPSS
jgi:UPF0176 protein